MSRPLVSCLLVTYNQEQWIEEALQSMLAQTYSPLEIVVSDDASTDGTYPLLTQLVGAYQGPHRIILRRNAVRRNVVGHLADAIPTTTGELIVVAAGDDVSLPDRVERIARVWESSGRRAHALNSGLQQIDENGVRGVVLPGCGGRPRSTLEDFADRAGTFFGASGAYSRAVFERFGPLDPFNIFEDQVLPFRAAMLGEVMTLDETLVLWRRLSRSNSVQFLDRPAQAKARLGKILYQQQQLACYQTQRVADIDAFLSTAGRRSETLLGIQARLRASAARANSAAMALQRPLPTLALLREVLRGALPLKQAAKLVTLYRYPALSDWWARFRRGN